MDMSLDEIIAREGVGLSQSRPQISGKRVEKEVKTNGLQNVLFEVKNDLKDLKNQNNTKRKIRSEDSEEVVTTVIEEVDTNETNSSKRGLPFDANSGLLFVDNLKYEVNDEDIQQLFGAFGPLKRAAINYKMDGRSAGSALVVFKQRSDAMTAYKSLLSVTFDGRILQLTLIEANEGSVDQKFNRIATNLNTRLKSQPKKEWSGSSGGGRQLWNDIAKNYDSKDPKEEINSYRNKRFNSGVNSELKSKEKEVLTSEDLDADLESYLSQRNKV